ncbi:MAG: NAD(P)H-binding protein [Bacteroidota bacterium]
MGNKSALVIGATGLVGKELTKKLLSLDDYSEIRIISRNPTGFNDFRLKETLVDFNNLSDVKEKFDVDDVFCCIGTTMKKAGTEERFVQIDYEYPIQIAKYALESGQLKKFLIVTAVGANPESSIFYNQVKGELERDLQTLQLPGLYIFRPSLLLGERTEFRVWESVGKTFSAFLSFFLIGSEKKVWAIQSDQVAAAMVQIAQSGAEGVYFYEPSKIRFLART